MRLKVPPIMRQTKRSIMPSMPPHRSPLVMAHTTPQTEIRIKSAQMVLSSIQTFLGTIFQLSPRAGAAA